MRKSNGLLGYCICHAEKPVGALKRPELHSCNKSRSQSFGQSELYTSSKTLGPGLQDIICFSVTWTTFHERGDIIINNVQQLT